MLLPMTLLSLVVWSCLAVVTAFVAPSLQSNVIAGSTGTFTFALQANNNNQNVWEQVMAKHLTVAAITTSVLFGGGSGVITTTTPSASIFSSPLHIPMATAKEMASGSGSRVNKDPESLLRYALPIKNKEVRILQSTIETINQDIGSKRKTAAVEGVKKTRYLLTANTKSLVSSCRDNAKAMCEATIQKMLTETLDPLEASLKESLDSFNGSEQERAALDAAYKKQTELAQRVGILEEAMVPLNYVTPVPEEYSDLPQLQGRATVEFTLKKGSPDENGNTVFDVNGQNYPTAKLIMVIDGYVAPITGGNFVDLVQKGFYNNMPIQRSDGFVVQTGDPEGEADGYVGTPGKALGAGKHGERLIPLEITVKGDNGVPLYESTIEELGRGGEATVLPFSSYGAMGWAREEYDPNSGSSQFFWLLFDSDLTPAGKNLLDGNYPCFGYVVEGNDFLSAIKEGDIITSAKVIKGAENLKQPK